MSTPSFAAYAGSSACSASTNAARPPAFCASTCAESRVKRDRPRRDDCNRNHIFRAQPHDRTLAKLLLQPGKGQLNCFAAVICHDVFLLTVKFKRILASTFAQSK